MERAKAIQTVIEMITQRGYDIISDEEDKIVARLNNTNICVFTDIIGKFNVERVKEYTSLLHKLKLYRCIIIYNNTITPTAKKLLLTPSEYQIELFNENELQYNLTKHRLVPNHIRLEGDESKEFKIKYGVKFPMISRNDPVSRFYNFKHGDIIKIVYKNGNIAYRIVK